MDPNLCAYCIDCNKKIKKLSNFIVAVNTKCQMCRMKNKFMGLCKKIPKVERVQKYFQNKKLSKKEDISINTEHNESESVTELIRNPKSFYKLDYIDSSLLTQSESDKDTVSILLQMSKSDFRSFQSYPKSKISRFSNKITQSFFNKPETKTSCIKVSLLEDNLTNVTSLNGSSSSESGIDHSKSDYMMSTWSSDWDKSLDSDTEFHSVDEETSLSVESLSDFLQGVSIKDDFENGINSATERLANLTNTFDTSQRNFNKYCSDTKSSIDEIVNDIFKNLIRLQKDHYNKIDLSEVNFNQNCAQNQLNIQAYTNLLQDLRYEVVGFFDKSNTGKDDLLNEVDVLNRKLEQMQNSALDYSNDGEHIGFSSTARYEIDQVMVNFSKSFFEK